MPESPPQSPETPPPDAGNAPRIAPPIPVLVGDAAAELLRQAGFPAWFRPWAIVTAILLIPLCLLSWLLVIDRGGGLLMHDGRNPNKLLLEVVAYFVSAAPTTAAIILLFKAAGAVRKMRDAAKGIP